MNLTVQDIYHVLDTAAPFALQESYDNSGLLVGAADAAVHHVLLALDITIPVVEEAVSLGADLILSHHPVIWGGLKQIAPTHPVWHLIQHNIAAISSHTCMDIAPEGVNAVLEQLLRTGIGLQGEAKGLLSLSGGRNLGHCCALEKETTAELLAKSLETVLGCKGLRYYTNGQSIRKVAWCGGSGGDLVGAALACGADALITGDVKHSEWCEAQNRSMTVIDCGHFFTEQPVLARFHTLLKDAFPLLQITETTTLQSSIYSVL